MPQVKTAAIVEILRSGSPQILFVIIATCTVNSHSAPPRMLIYVFSKGHFEHAPQNPPVVCCCRMRGDAPNTFAPGEWYGSRSPAHRSVPSPTSAHREGLC